MIQDKIISQFVHVLKKEREQLAEDLSVATIPDLYSLGRIQGKVEGLRFALEILDRVLEDLDN